MSNCGILESEAKVFKFLLIEGKVAVQPLKDLDKISIDDMVLKKGAFLLIDTMFREGLITKTLVNKNYIYKKA